MAVREYRRLMREEIAEPYDEVASWGQVIKGEETFADRVLQSIGEPPAVRRGLLVEQVARQVASREDLTLADLRSESRRREVSKARLLTAWLGRKVGGISIARTAKYFGRDASAMIRGVARMERGWELDKRSQQLVEKLRRAVRSGNTTKHD